MPAGIGAGEHLAFKVVLCLRILHFELKVLIQISVIDLVRGVPKGPVHFGARLVFDDKLSRSVGLVADVHRNDGVARLVHRARAEIELKVVADQQPKIVSDSQPIAPLPPRI